MDAVLSAHAHTEGCTPARSTRSVKQHGLGVLTAHAKQPKKKVVVSRQDRLKSSHLDVSPVMLGVVAHVDGVARLDRRHALTSRTLHEGFVVGVFKR